MQGAVKLAAFDAGRLLEDYERLQVDDWMAQADYTISEAGDWTAIPLTSHDGSHTDARALRLKPGDVAHPTDLLKKSPYFQEVLDSFQTEIQRARLMKLRAGKVIREHRDAGLQPYSFEAGWIRVHVPIITHEDVKWRLMGKPVPLALGEAWYLNIQEPHSVENLSEIDRVHLVIDMKVNGHVRSLFPTMSATDHVVCAYWRTAGLPLWRFRILRWLWFKQKVRTTLGNLGLRRVKRALSR